MNRTLHSILTSLFALLFVVACQQQSEPPASSDTSTDSNEARPASDKVSETGSAGEEQAAVSDDGDCDLVMGYDIWAPYHFEAPDGTVMGIEIDLIRSLLADQECSVSFVQDDWMNLLEMVKTGDIDVVPGATAVAGREDYAWFSIPYRLEQFEIFVREGITLPSKNLLELAGSELKIGLTDGYFYGQLVDLAQQQHPESFVYSQIAESSLLKLIDGQISLMIEDPYVVNMILHQKDWHDDIERTGIEVANTPVSFMFSKKTTSGKQLLDFNMRLADFLASQSDEEILNSYLSDL